VGELLAGRTVAVTGTGEPLADGLVAAVDAAGAQVVELDGASSLDGVVHVAMPAIAYERIPFHEVDDARWDAVWEQTLRNTLRVLQTGFRAMNERGGAFVMVTPVVGMAGAAELGPYSAAVEGVRILGKAAARQWGAHGIRVNCLAPAPEHVPIGVASSGLALSPPALGGPGDPEADLGPIAVWLLSDGAHFLTGTTLCADGGVWMAP
jgi:NAD(P)-dependent dehydrogenase (short-subunit alcohol dehydrogenase family)